MKAPSPVNGLASNLALLLPLLDAFAHRNKNQHRPSHWWSHFNILRRAIRDLCYAPLAKQDASYIARAKRLSTIIVPRCYIKFTQLAADNQFAPLGLALLSVLAQVHSALREVLPVEQHQPHNAISTKRPLSPSIHENALVVDKGITVSRDAASADLPTKESMVEDASSSSVSKEKSRVVVENTKDESIPKASKRKSKKKGDALSSLFGSL